MDLRDRFASSFAQALVTQGVLMGASELALRAYDLADAMLTERARRIEADERSAFEDDPLAFDDELETEPMPLSLHLLDDAAPPPDDDAREEALAAWLEARAADETSEGPTSKAPRSLGPGSEGPGLAKARDLRDESEREGEQTGS